MAQQPNIHLSIDAAPLAALEPDPARSWASEDRPAVADHPDDRTWGGTFGTPGPNTGYAYRIIRHFDRNLPQPLVEVLAALMGARASLYGRAPIREDYDVARFLCGMFEQATPELIARRYRWMAATFHEQSKGRTAVSEVEMQLLADSPARVKLAVALSR